MNDIIIYIIVFVILLVYYSLYITTPHEYIWNHHYNIVFNEKQEDKQYNGSLIILITLYNSNVSLLQKRIDYLMKYVSDWQLYVYGLDSTNETTIRELYQWKHTNPHIHLVEPLPQLPKNRTVRIASIRNALLNAIQQSNTNNDNRIVLMYDGDHRGPMSRNGLISSLHDLESHPEWFAISSSGSICVFPGIHIIYDSFAFRSIDETSSIPRCHWLLPEFLPVTSSFSGACLYRWKELQQFRYPFVENVCEHVSLHKQMKDILHKNMVMSKKFQILVGHQPSIL